MQDIAYDHVQVHSFQNFDQFMFATDSTVADEIGIAIKVVVQEEGEAEVNAQEEKEAKVAADNSKRKMKTTPTTAGGTCASASTTPSPITTTAMIIKTTTRKPGSHINILSTS